MRATPLVGTPLLVAGLSLPSLAPDWGDRLIKVGVILLASWILYRGVVVVTRRLERSVVEGGSGVLSAREQRGRTLAQIVRNASTVALSIVAGVAVLSVFVPNATGPLTAAVGVLGLALSFGAQALVKDLIGGFFMLVEGQYQVGDVIRVNESTSGQVEKVTMRVVVLRDVQGVLHTIPHGEIHQVSNLTKGWSRAVLEIGVAYGEDVDRVIEVLSDIGRGLWQDADWRPRLVEEPVVPGVERFEDSAVVIRFMAKTLPLKQWEVARELRRRIKNRFDEEGIEIPFPHRTLYWGRGQTPSPSWASPAVGVGPGAPSLDTGHGGDA